MKKDAQERLTGLHPSAFQSGRDPADRLPDRDADTDAGDDFWRGGDAVYLRHLEAHPASAARSWTRLQSRLSRRASGR